jgi:RND family efflux transporter MFP subunit
MIETSRGGQPIHTRNSAEPARPWKMWLVIAIVAVAAAVAIYRGVDARTKAAASVKQETMDLAVPTVAVAHPRRGSMENEVVIPGNMQAFIDSPIYARASGYLKAWHADIGAHVKAGQALAEIEAPELDHQVDQAKAALEQARAALDQSQASLEQGKANEELARVNAARWNNLVAKGVVSKQDNDQYQAQYQALTANRQALEKAVTAAQSNIASSAANVARLQELQGYEVVRAPFDGVITIRNTDIGALINAGNGGPAQELFHIASTAKLRVYVNIPEVYSQAAVPGISADLTLAEFPGKKFRGKLVRTSDAMDAGTRTLLAEVDVDNAKGELKPGSYTQVHLLIPATVPSVIVPVGALLFRSEGLRVGVVRDGKSVLIPVVPGKDYGTEVEILSGVQPNDEVIVNPPDSLVSGTAVHTVEQNAPSKP